MSSNGRQRKLRWILVPLIVLGVIFFVSMFVPVLDGPNARQHANEAVSATTLLSIVKLQSSYAAAHPMIGFACELPRLKSQEPVKNGYLNEDKFLMTGERAGYRFAIAGCRADVNGVVTHYQLTAVPREPGKSGIRAFCTDESAQLWYDSAGSSVNCLTSRHQLSLLYVRHKVG
jgi:hypothetical protein